MLLDTIRVQQNLKNSYHVDRVTKKFYDRFKTEHASFLGFINGIPDQKLQRWYASVMLNRLIFIYFIQKNGFLDGDINYLYTKLGQCKAQLKNLYTDFLCPLFFEGFAKKEEERSPDTQKLLGKIPYLNGGIFLRHQIEELHGKNIQIADSAYEKLFVFFEQYQWHLDERPLCNDNEINPDVLGYIFEKYINQKQMGAYYTKEDITEYISKNTIIPFLFDTALGNKPEDTIVWRLLRDDPDRYIYDAVKKGIKLPLPENIKIGLDNVSKRTEWNKPALRGVSPRNPKTEEYALPTEVWREVVARRKRYEEIRAKLANGEIRNINDFITYNLNIRQFAQDVIEYCEEPELLRAFWHAIEKIKILDPTCGSGAFLFAALNILEPLYEACVNRMQIFINELDHSGEKHYPEKYNDFRKVLDDMSKHPNPRYFILKSIMVDNLYGVDIMDEAVEICKLRMFLKLVAQVESAEKIEPLPDMDFNIRAGNTLVGFTTYDDAKNALSDQEWLRSHKPFHWFIEFHSILKDGGFDVIIGNPPYISSIKTRKEYTVRNYDTENCADIYAWVLERVYYLLKQKGRSGTIVPLSICFGKDFNSCRKLLFTRYGINWFSSYGRIPSALFSFDVRVRNTIHIGYKCDGSKILYTTRLHRWYESARPQLFETIEYALFTPELWQNHIPKFGNYILSSTLENCLSNTHSTVGVNFSPSQTPYVLYFKKTAYNWLNFCRNLPPCYDDQGNNTIHTQFDKLYFSNALLRDLAFLLLNGKLVYVLWCILGDDFHVSRWMFANFPIDLSKIPKQLVEKLLPFVDELERAMNNALSFKLNAGKKVGNFNLAKCRHVTELTDSIFAEYIGLDKILQDIELLYTQIVRTEFD